MNTYKKLDTAANGIGHKLLTPDELAEYLGCKKKSVYKFVAERRLPFVKLGRLLRFDLEDIKAWVQKNKVLPNEF